MHSFLSIYLSSLFGLVLAISALLQVVCFGGYYCQLHCQLIIFWLFEEHCFYPAQSGDSTHSFLSIKCWRLSLFLWCATCSSGVFGRYCCHLHCWLINIFIVGGTLLLSVWIYLLWVCEIERVSSCLCWFLTASNCCSGPRWYAFFFVDLSK